MVTSLGIDIIETARIKSAVERFGERFLRRILGVDELPIYQRRRDRYEFLAGRFAAKEAAVKALGKYLDRRPPFNAIQIVNDDRGQPRLVFPEKISGRLVGVRSLMSISHSRYNAVAIVIFEEV
ncbi:MAG: holo-ACP synthase [candidate division Zixibacteria bacterium]|nr:holo-ACP synthase [candidate division Zixibacteria bacterium]